MGSSKAAMLAVVALSMVLGSMGGKISRQTLGINPKDITKYKSPFSCLDGSGTIEASRINDDYCDCADGSDEPGTSACSYHFYCSNKGHISESIFSSRVNDGVCDCCDGTDEYLGHTQCENTCNTLAKEKASAEQEKQRIRQEGLKAKEEKVGESKRMKQEKEAQLQQMRGRMISVQAEKEAAEKIKDEKEAAENAVKEQLKADRLAKEEEEKKEKEAEEAQKAAEAAAAGEEPKEPKDPEAAEGDEDKDESEEDEAEKEEEEEDAKPEGKKTKAEDEYKDQEAEEARSEFEEKRSAFDDLDKEINTLSALLANDYGKEDEFFYLTEECPEYDARDYIYKLCVFKEVQQVPAGGHGGTNMGKWKEWQKSDYGVYGTTDLNVQHYTNGQGCWQGPERSTTVKMVCGKEDKVLVVDEPSKCVYQMTLQTPAACF